MADFVFTCRPHAMAHQRTYELGADDIVVTETGKVPRRIPLGDITKVGLS